MPWIKGQSGNAGGRPKTKEFTEKLRYHLLKISDEPFTLSKEYNRLDVIAMATVKEAIKGESWAVKEVADRLEGKVPQALIGDPENPINFSNITLSIVRPEHTSS